MRDICFKIMRMCSSFSFADLIASPKDFEELLATATPTINDLLTNSCFVETKSCKLITTINWPQGLQSITHRSETSIVTEKELKELIDENHKKDIKVLKAITVTKLDIGWFMKTEDKFLGLTQSMKKAQNKSLYTTDFVLNILD